MLRDKEIYPVENGWKLIDYGNKASLDVFKQDEDGCIKTKAYGSTVRWSAPENRPHRLLKKFKNDKAKAAFSGHTKNDSEYYNLISYALDIWQIGLIIFYVLFGQQPYELSYWEDLKCDLIPFTQ